MTSAAARDDLAHADIGLVVALNIEIAPFLKRCDRLKTYSGGRFTFRGGRLGNLRIAVAECGMGFVSARAATQALMDAHSPAWLLSVGFSGALQPELRCGDIVVADSIVDRHQQEFHLDMKMPADPAQGLYVGRLLTVDQLVRTVAEKKTLANETGALACDLESLAVAQVCRERAQRFMAVRVISDDLTADLPPEVLSVVGATGAVRVGAAVASLWKRPSSLGDLWRLRETANNAADRLALFLDGVLMQLPTK